MYFMFVSLSIRLYLLIATQISMKPSLNPGKLKAIWQEAVALIDPLKNQIKSSVDSHSKLWNQI